MKTFFSILASFILAVASAFFSSPLFLLLVSLILAQNRFFKQALLTSFIGGIFYSLLSFGNGFLGFGLLSLLLTVGNLPMIELKELVAGPRIIDFSAGAAILFAAHCLLFRVFFSPSLLLLFVLYLLLSWITPHILSFLKRPKYLGLKRIGEEGRL